MTDARFVPFSISGIPGILNSWILVCGNSHVSSISRAWQAKNLPTSGLFQTITPPEGYFDGKTINAI
jgi:hypothetical protein